MRFARYVGIDYSGAETPTRGLSALRVYAADGNADPHEVRPVRGERRHWTRRGLAEWLREELRKPAPTVVGIDHGFSFPLAWFERWGLARDWTAFLEDFRAHWPTDGDEIYVDDVRDGLVGDGAARAGDATWLRLTERWTATAKSVFLFDVQGSVAKSTHAGLPWLRFLRSECGERVQFWPFDGWDVPAGRSVVAEVYPALWMRRFPRGERNADQHAAYAVAAWLRRADATGELAGGLAPALTREEREIARLEGWILGVR